MQLISFGRPGLLLKSIRDTCEATESSWFRLIMAPQLENVNAESSTFPVEFYTGFISDTIFGLYPGRTSLQKTSRPAHRKTSTSINHERWIDAGQLSHHLNHCPTPQPPASDSGRVRLHVRSASRSCAIHIQPYTSPEASIVTRTRQFVLVSNFTVE